MSESTLVSVVIPAYNAGAFLGEAIESALQQEHRPIEVIVVDDGSSDHTAEVARAFGPTVTLHCQPHAGAGAARNRGVAESHGELLAFLDADDVWTAGKLRHQMAVLSSDPALDIVLGHAVEFRDGKERGMVENPPVAGALPSAALIRMSSFHRVGWLRTDLRVGEFIDWLARAREIGLKTAVARETVLLRRIHETNTGIRERQSRADYAKVVRAALERRRAASSEEPR
jgi:glycosyltransferase involved in cell wall biosynthesis